MLACSGLSGLGTGRTLRDALEKCLRSDPLRLSRLSKPAHGEAGPEGTRQSGQGQNEEEVTLGGRGF